MKLVRNWRRVALRAHSMWFGCYLPIAWLIVPEIAYAAGYELSPRLVWVLALALAVAGVLRLRDQRIGHD